MQVIPPKGPTVNMPRGAKTTQVKPAPAVEPPKSSTAGKVAGNIAAGGATAVAGLAGLAMLSGGKKAETEKPTSSVSPAPQSSVSPAPKPKQDDMTFGQAFKKAREMSGGKSTGQFTWHGKEYQTNIQGKGTATKPQEKYIAPKLQTKTGLDVPKATTASATTPAAAAAPKAPETPKPATTPETSTVARTMPAQLGGKEPEKTTVATPQVSYERPQFPMSTKSSFEDGGKKKKMSEESNPIIAMFLKLQEKNALSPNIFEAAKKMSSKEKSLASLGHPKDKITKKDVLIGRGVLPRDVEEGAGEETAKKETSMSVTMDNKPSTPAQTTAATSGPSASDKKALDTKIKSIAKEEVEEIDEISVGTAYSYAAKKMEKERKGLLPGDYNPSSKTDLKNMTNAANRTEKDYYKKRGFKKVTATEEVENLNESTRSLGALAAEMYHHASIGHYGENEDMSHKQIQKHVDAFHAKKAAIAAKHGPEVAHAVAHHAEQMAHHDNSSFAHVDKKEHHNFVKKILGGVGSKQHEIYKRTLSSKGYDGAHQVDLAESVSFSQAEIDHINSFFEAVAPSRAEPTKGVNPTVRNTDLTDETLEEGRPRKNPTPETTERDARQHIQVQAGRASGGTVVDFKHDNGKISKLTPGMGRAITAHLNGLKPAERQEAVKRMHASPEGLKV